MGTNERSKPSGCEILLGVLAFFLFYPCVGSSAGDPTMGWGFIVAFASALWTLVYLSCHRGDSVSTPIYLGIVLIAIGGYMAAIKIIEQDVGAPLFFRSHPWTVAVTPLALGVGSILAAVLGSLRLRRIAGDVPRRNDGDAA